MIRKWLHDRRILGLSATVLFVLLLLSTVVLPLVGPPERERRVLWYPDSTRTATHAEFRFVPYRENPRDAISLYLQELRLGPARMGSIPFLPREIRIRSVLLDERNRLYLDFSPEMAVLVEELDFSLEEIEETIRRNVLHNFPFVQEIVFTVGGQVPNVPRFGIPTLTKGRSAL